jgi:hypothetical protein
MGLFSLKTTGTRAYIPSARTGKQLPGGRKMNSIDNNIASNVKSALRLKSQDDRDIHDKSINIAQRGTDETDSIA